MKEPKFKIGEKVYLIGSSIDIFSMHIQNIIEYHDLDHEENFIGIREFSYQGDIFSGEKKLIIYSFEPEANLFLNFLDAKKELLRRIEDQLKRVQALQPF